MSYPRRGVSLLEVLFSIGVVAVGILGISAAYVVALHQSGRGHVADQAARMGMNAVDSFNLRAMGFAGTWRAPNGTANGEAVDLSANPNRSFAIDPLFVAANNDSLVDATNGYDGRVFPYVASTTEPRMTRLSLYSGASAAQLMGRLQAEEIFLAQDELVYDVPPDVTLPPVQQYSIWLDPNNNNNPVEMKRQSEGRFSWMATLVPRIDASQDSKDLYILSIVVFHRRDASYAMNATNERVVSVRDFTGAGFAGGDVVLQSSTIESLDVKAGDWLMLMGNLTTVTPFFRWYRVLDASSEAEENTSTNLYEREVALQGSDWPTNLAGGGVAQAALISNVVAVYERTIRLESTSLWTW